MKRNSPLVSIILPTYNVSAYLPKCIESIINQSYQNYEVIIVIDGATDGSLEIAKNYSLNNSNIHVYYQENAGSGPARNKGLIYANGEFVMFVDPDDWLESDCLEQLMDAQQDGDYDLTISNKINCVFNANEQLISKTKVKTFDFKIVGEKLCREEYVEMLKKGLLGAPTRKIYKLSIIRDNKVDFPPFRRSQDIVFNYRYYDHISSIRSIDYCGYYYRISMKNGIGKIKHDYYKTISTIYTDIKSLHAEWGVTLDLTKLSSLLFLENLYGYLQVSAYNKDDITDVYKDTTIREIISFSNPSSIYAQIVCILLRKKQYKFANMILSAIYYIKVKKNM